MDDAKPFPKKVRAQIVVHPSLVKPCSFVGTNRRSAFPGVVATACVPIIAYFTDLSRSSYLPSLFGCQTLKYVTMDTEQIRLVF